MNIRKIKMIISSINKNDVYKDVYKDVSRTLNKHHFQWRLIHLDLNQKKSTFIGEGYEFLFIYLFVSTMKYVRYQQTRFSILNDKIWVRQKQII
jgi:hypothetical protein